jgi:hypothetical protein
VAGVDTVSILCPFPLLNMTPLISLGLKGIGRRVKGQKDSP